MRRTHGSVLTFKQYIGMLELTPIPSTKSGTSANPESARSSIVAADSYSPNTNNTFSVIDLLAHYEQGVKMIQQKDVAAEISQLMVDCGSKLNSSVGLVKARCSAEEFEVYRKAIGTLMADILLEVMNPLYAQHPDLRPDELEKRRESHENRGVRQHKLAESGTDHDK